MGESPHGSPMAYRLCGELEDMLKRFVGPEGARFAAEALRKQPIIGTDAGLAEAICNSAEITSFEPGATVIEEGSPDNDIYFILAGMVSIRVKGSEVAVRTEGQHVGEMALVDVGQPRSASAIAKDEVVVARVSAAAFNELAESNPNLWKNLARELGVRLRERNRFVRPTNPRPALFIGCSTESLRIAQAIQSLLDHDDILVKPWTDSTFKVSEFAFESLEQELSGYDFAALVLSDDDEVISRGQRRDAPRDNIIFELGVFMGAIGRSRTFLVQPRGVALKIPSDIFGITPLTYAVGPEKDFLAALAPVCNRLRATILTMGPR